MALERVPADIRREGMYFAPLRSPCPLTHIYRRRGQNGERSRAQCLQSTDILQSDPKMIKEIQCAVTIPVMAKVRIGHIVEAQVSFSVGTVAEFRFLIIPWQILQAIGIDYIDESEVLTPADDEHHLNKHNYKVPFVCGARDLGEALRRISEGAAMIRTKGEAGTGNVVEAVRHQRAVMSQIRKASVMSDEELYTFAKEIQAPYHLVKETARLKRLPVVNFAAGGIATPGEGQRQTIP